MMVIRLIHTKPFWSVILEVLLNPLISLMPRVKYDDENTILTFEHTTAGLLSHIPGGSDITFLDNTHVFYARRLSTHGGNIRAMDPTRDGNVDATKDTFHSFIWKGKRILVRIDTDIRKYCINSLLKV